MVIVIVIVVVIAIVIVIVIAIVMVSVIIIVVVIVIVMVIVNSADTVVKMYLFDNILPYSLLYRGIQMNRRCSLRSRELRFGMVKMNKATAKR